MNKEDKYQETQIKWNMSANEIINNTNKVIEKSKNTYDKISKFNIVENEIHNFISLLSNDLSEFNNFHSICGFLQYVSPDDKIRKAGYIADFMLSKYINELNAREDIYNKLILIKNLHL